MGSVQRPRRGGRWTLGYRIAQCRLQDRPEYFSLLVMPEFRIGGSYLGGQYGASLPGKHEVGSAVSDPSVAGVVAADGDDAIAHRAVDFRSEEHTSELQSLMRISYDVCCLQKKHNPKQRDKYDTSHE